MEGISFSKDARPEDKEEIAPNMKNYVPFQKSKILKEILGKDKREGKHKEHCKESILG